MKQEENFVNQLHLKFANFFEVQREVWSECGTRRIDMLLSIQGKYHFGIECKAPDKKRGEQIGRYIQQAHSYTHLKWKYRNDISVQVPIFICPALSYKYFILNEHEVVIDGKKYHQDRHSQLHSHHTINGMLGVWNVGEVRKTELGFQFVMCNKPFYEHKSYNNTFISRVHEINYNTYIERICNQ